jgi:hypothetical protein
MTQSYNNPGNIRPGQNYAGETGEVYTGTDGSEYVVFESRELGVRAMFMDFRTKIKRYKGDLDAIFAEYAPPEDDNPTDQYVAFVKQAVGKSNVYGSDLTEVVKAAIAFENGPNSALTKSYTAPAVLEEAYALSSVQLPKDTTLEQARAEVFGDTPVTPENKETIIASASAPTKQQRTVSAIAPSDDARAKRVQRLIDAGQEDPISIIEARSIANQDVVDAQIEENLGILEQRQQPTETVDDTTVDILEERQQPPAPAAEEVQLDLLEERQAPQVAAQTETAAPEMLERAAPEVAALPQPEAAAEVVTEPEPPVQAETFLRPSQPIFAFERRAAERAAKAAQPTFFEAVEASIDEDWMMSWAMREREEFLPDVDFSLTMEEYQKATAGLPEEYHGFVENSVSSAHLSSLRQEALQSFENDKKLASLGWKGVGVRFGVALSDPGAIGLSIATEGVAAPLIWGNKLSRLQRAFRGGTAAAATNAMIEGYIVSQNAVKDPYDILYSASAGLVFGGALSSFGKGAKGDEFDAALSKISKDADIAQQQEIVAAVNREIVGEGVAPPLSRTKLITNAEVDAALDKAEEAKEAVSEARKAKDAVGTRLDQRVENGEISAEEAKRLEAESPEFIAFNNAKKAFTEADNQANKAVADFARQPIERSVGAAENPFDKPVQVGELRADLDEALDISGERQDPAIEKLRFDMAGFLLGSKQPTGNLLGRLLPEDPVGFRKDPTQVVAPSADLIKTNEFKAVLNDYYDVVNPAYKEWSKSEGFTGVTGYFKRTMNLPRRQFMELVADAIENPTLPFHPAVRRAAQKQSELQRDLLGKMKDSGVRGSENIPEDLTYFSHLWDSFKFGEAAHRYGDDVVQNLLTRSLINATDELNEDAASMIAKHMLDKIRRSEAGMDSGAARLFTTDQTESMRSILVEEEFMTPEEADRLLDLFQRRPDGTPARLKRRLRFNMNETVTAFNKQTQTEEVLRLKDLQERDAEQVFTSYAGGMSGRIALARVGIKDETTFNKMLNQNLAEAESMLGNAGKPRAEKENLVAQTIYNAIINRRMPLAADPTGVYARSTRLLQDYNFVRLMNQVGFTQIGELGNALSIGGVRGVLQSVPAVRSMLKRARDGKIEDPVIRDVIAATGISADRNINQSMNRADTIGVFSEGRGDWIDKALFMAAPAKRFTADVSGMAPVTLMLERIAARCAVQTMTDLAFKARKMSRKRLAGLGMSEEMAERVQSQIRKHAVTQKSLVFRNYKIRDINANAWDDAEARHVFFAAISRMTRRGIQQNDVGNLNLYMTSTMGQVITQFRSFMLVSWAKQFLHNVKAADFRAFEAMMGSVAFASLGYMAQTQVNAQFRDDKEEYLEKMLSIEALGKASFQRSSWASLFPSLVDTGGAFFTDDPVFAYRSTGLDTNLISGIPSVQLISKGLGTAQAASRSLLNPDLQFSQGQQRALNTLVPWQNAVGIKNALNKLVEMRPETTKVQ